MRIRKEAGNAFVSTNFPSDIALGLSYLHLRVSPGDCGNRVAFRHQRAHEVAKFLIYRKSSLISHGGEEKHGAIMSFIQLLRCPDKSMGAGFETAMLSTLSL